MRWRIWRWAPSTFESALYFSTSTYVAIGYGDLVLDHAWRVTGAIEGANGIILLGWSTAFLVGVVSKLRILERRWGEKDGSRLPVHESNRPFTGVGA